MHVGDRRHRRRRPQRREGGAAALPPSARETLSTSELEAPGVLTDMLVTGMGQLGANGALWAIRVREGDKSDYTVQVSIGGDRRRAPRAATPRWLEAGAAPRPPGTQHGGMVQMSLTIN